MKPAVLRGEIAFEPHVADGPLPRPFAKWAGGKRQLLDELFKHVPSTFGTYFEPFVGGGALFFALRPAHAVIGDANLFLAATYKAVRDDVDAVIRLLKFHEARHSKAHFLATRAALIDPSNGRPIGPPVNVAARVIYLNRTCFNGLWRVNKRGQFNVPMGNYENPTICDAPNLRACARTLSLSGGVKIFHASFERVMAHAKRGDFVYCDPPYIPLREGSFVAYDKSGFTMDHQAELAAMALSLRRAGVHVLLSNSDTPQARKLYTGWNIRRVDARRNINSDAKGRGSVGELLIW